MRDKTNSPDEILDLVDQNDRVIGEVVKLQADNNPFFTVRKVNVLIYDAENRLLLHQRAANKKVNPLYWSITAAGCVLHKKSPVEIAHCELRQEAGFDAQLTFLEKVYIRYKYTSYFAYKYIGKYTGQIVAMDIEELADIRFIDKEEYAIMLELGIPFGKGSKQFIDEFWSGKFDFYR
jgi:isopentenyldiphosphate isomerase